MGTSAQQLFGRYALHDEIASGGMATVHLGRVLGPAGFTRTVAMKRLHPHFAREPSFVAMLMDEARIAGRITHPNVVRVLDVVSSDDDLALIMDYVRGEALSTLMRLATVPIPVAVAAAAGLLHGLHAAHELKDESGKALELVHRDVSPHNVIVGADGVPRLVDFGIAKASGRLQDTREGELKGKIAYMAPEQLSGIVDRTTDVWAAGVVLWEMLTGKRLARGENDVETMRAVLDAQFAPPSASTEGVSPDLDRIVMTALDRQPAKRFNTAREMALALEGLGELMPAVRVGEWVESVAGESLAARDRLIEKMHGAVTPNAEPTRVQPAATTTRGTPSKGAPSTLMYEFVDELCILVHGEQSPSDVEWQAYVDYVRLRLGGLERARARPLRWLVVADSVSLTPRQRGVLNKMIQEFGRPVPTAVITHSIGVRGIVSVMGWFNSAIRSFAPDDLTSALEYLGVDAGRRADILDRVVRMRVALSRKLRPSESVDLRQIASDMDSLMLKRLPALRQARKEP